MNLPPLDEIQPRRVLLIKPSALGDVVQTLPILSALRQRYPEAHLAWLVNRSLTGILETHPDLDEVIPFVRHARSWQRASTLWQLGRRLRGRFDLAIDLQGLLRSGLMARWSGATRRVGLADAREGAAHCYTDRVQPPAGEQPALARYWSLAAALGCGQEPPAPRLGISPLKHVWAARQLESLPRPLLAIHPGALWETKRWPPRHFAALAKRAWQTYGAGVVLVGGPDDRGRADELAADLPGPLVNLAGKTDLLQLAAVTSQAHVFLSGDTGPMHLAAAVGTPVVAVFTCTSPLRAGPHGPDHQVVATRVSCAASYLRTCATMHCRDELTPLRVWPALAHALETSRGKRRLAG